MIVPLVNIVPCLQNSVDKQHVPLGILHVGSALVEAGFPAKLYHVDLSEVDAAVEEIVKSKPAVVGFSVLTGATTLHSALMSIAIKQMAPEIKIIWGGHHAHHTATQCLQESYVDFVCLGEGEGPMVELVRALDAKRPPDDVASIGWKTADGRIVLNKQAPRLSEIDALPLRWELADMPAHTIRSGSRRTTSFFSSRGCPYQCTFCSSVSYYERTWRAHSVEYVIGHLKHLRDTYGINSIYFADDLFMVNKKRGLEILEKMQELGMTCDTLDMRIHMVTEDLMKRFDELRVGGIFFGWEAGSDRVLKFMKKGFNREAILKGARILSKYPRVHVWASGILGIPTQTRDEVTETVNTALELRNILPNATCSVWNYMPLPGTELLPIAIREGFRPPTNPMDWRRSDPQDSSYRNTWSRWMTDRDRRNLWMTQEYTRSALAGSRNEGSRKLRHIVQRLFFDLAERRIRTQNFRLPVDLPVYRALVATWQGIYNVVA